MYNPEIATRICAELIEGKSLRAICAQEGMPAKATVLGWLQDDALPGFLDQYTRARTLQAETFLDEILEIADETSADTLQTKFGPMPDKEWILRSKLRVDARIWAMSKLAPKKYGDKLALTDGDGKPLPIPEIRIYTGAPPLAGSEKEVLE